MKTVRVGPQGRLIYIDPQSRTLSTDSDVAAQRKNNTKRGKAARTAALDLILREIARDNALPRTKVLDVVMSKCIWHTICNMVENVNIHKRNISYRSLVETGG